MLCVPLKNKSTQLIEWVDWTIYSVASTKSLSMVAMEPSKTIVDSSTSSSPTVVADNKTALVRCKCRYKTRQCQSLSSSSSITITRITNTMEDQMECLRRCKTSTSIHSSFWATRSRTRCSITAGMEVTCKWVTIVITMAVEVLHRGPSGDFT